MLQIPAHTAPALTSMAGASKVLILTASPRPLDESTSTQLAALFAEKARASGASVTTRDLNDLPYVDAAMAESYFVWGQRSATQKAAVAQSDALVEELIAHDTVVIATPIYNLGMPAPLKAYVDLICRPGKSFSIVPPAVVGLVGAKKTLAIVSSRGAPIGGDMDFATPLLSFIANFVGTTPFTVVDATPHAVVSPRDVITALFDNNGRAATLAPSPAKPPAAAMSTAAPVLRHRPRKTLVINSSPRPHDVSLSRGLAAQFAEGARAAGSQVTMRDVYDLPYLSAAMLDSFSAEGERSQPQKAAVKKSDELVAELLEHDTVVIALPIYNFWIPASLKAYVDLVMRDGVTFKYLADGTTVPLVEGSGKQVFVLPISGGSGVGSVQDYVTPYLPRIFGCMGITDLQLINGSGYATGRQAVDATGQMKQAFAAVQ